MQRTRIAALAAAALVLVAACGDDDTTTTATTSAPPTTTAVADAPERIVSLSPTATEVLFAVGAGDQVVAVDSYSTYPADAPITDLSAYEPNVEAIADYDPDLVVVEGTDPELIDGLETLGIEVLQAPASQTLEDTYAQIEDIGEATGHAEEAADVVDGMRADIEDLVADVTPRDEPLTYYHELDNTLYTVTSSTFIGALYELAGLENVADPADTDGQAGGYPQLSTEFLVQADPDLIFLADTKCCDQTAESFATRPGFGALSAVAAGQVVELDDDIASRWGPRVVDLLAAIVDAVKAVPTS